MRLLLRFRFYFIVFYLSCVKFNINAQEAKSEILTQRYHWNTLQALSDEVLLKMPLDDPLLRTAYAEVINAESRPPEWGEAVWRDLTRRGNDAIPLMLSLFRENPDTIFRDELMTKIIHVRTIDPKPFLNEARQLFRKEGQNLPLRTRYAMAELFEKRGTAADMEILKMMDYDPTTNSEHGLDLSSYIRGMNKRLAEDAAGKGPSLHQTEATMLEAKRVWPPDPRNSRTQTVDPKNATEPPSVAVIPKNSNAPRNNINILIGIAVVVLAGIVRGLFFRFNRATRKRM